MKILLLRKTSLWSFCSDMSQNQFMNNNTNIDKLCYLNLGSNLGKVQNWCRAYTHEHTQTETVRQTDRKTYIQADRQKNRQTDRQNTHTHTHTHTHIHTHKHRPVWNSLPIKPRKFSITFSAWRFQNKH